MNTVVVLLTCLLSQVAALPVSQPPPGVIAPANTKLRGSDSAAPVYPVADAAAAAAAAAVAAPAPAAATPPFMDERGARGHFYYSDACEDCFYKATQCGCQPAVEYFACLTKHCHSSNGTRFNKKCTDLGNQCSSELDIDCRGPKTVCESKFNQLPTGGMGLTLEPEGMLDDAFCGPSGVCIGEIHMKANVHMGLPDNATGALAAAPPAPTWLECGRPKVSKADVNNQAQWDICRAEVVVVGEAVTAACDLPNTWSLDVSKDKKVYCLLTEGNTGTPPKRLTAPAWHYISNAHDNQVKAPEHTKEAPKPATTKAPKPAATKAPKPAATKAPKPAAKPADKTSDKPVRTAKQSSTKEDAEDESSKLPWMRNKPKKEAPKPAAKPEEPARHTNDASGLPWMQSKEPAAAEKAPKKQAPKEEADEEDGGDEEEPVAPVQPKDDAKPTEETEPVEDRMAETASGEETVEDKMADEAAAKGEEADDEDEDEGDHGEKDDDNKGLRW